MIIQWHVSAISEGRYVNRGDPRSSFSFIVCQKQLPIQGESVNKKGEWNHARWQPIAQTMHLIYANLKEQCLDSKSKLCTILPNIFIAKQHRLHHFHTSSSVCVSLFFFSTEDYNLLLLSSWWNSALLYSVGVCLPLWTLALAQMFAGTIGLNLLLLTYCNYMGSSYRMQNIFLKYDKTYLPEDSCENIPIVWKEVISFKERKFSLVIPYKEMRPWFYGKKCPGTQRCLCQYTLGKMY